MHPLHRRPGIAGLARRASLSLLFSALPLAAASKDWVEVRSPHFTVQSNDGEEKARHVAWEFEEMREVFHVFFPSMKVDPGKPVFVVAVDGEAAMRELLPDFWTSSSHARPAGLFLQNPDRNYAVVNMSAHVAAGDSLHALYHEYTHSILHLNFHNLPPWLDEGFAEFYGNTEIRDDEIAIGKMITRHTDLLRISGFIPVAALVAVDHDSPLYNEREQASSFYAESALLVHYLLSEPEAAKAQLLTRFLQTQDATGDPVKAASQAFGDLGAFQDKLKIYSRRPTYAYTRIKPANVADEKTYKARPMSRAEVLLAQAEVLGRRNNLPQAEAKTQEAIALDPKFAAGHTTLGCLDYWKADNKPAEKELALAVQLDPSDSRALFYLAQIEEWKAGYTEQSTPEIVRNLEQSIAADPDFAPAQAALATAYLHAGEARTKALAPALRAFHLEPMNLAYLAGLGNALLAAGRDAEARNVASQLQKYASNAMEKGIAETFAQELAKREEGKAKSAADPKPPAGS